MTLLGTLKLNIYIYSIVQNETAKITVRVQREAMTAKICINNSRQSSDMLSMQSDQCTRPAGVIAVVVSG